MVYRDRGAVGALLDEYERAIRDLKSCISTISQGDLIRIIDTETKNEDCRSVQTILSHVIVAGYYYASVTRNHLGDKIEHKAKETLDSVAAYSAGIDAMFGHTVQLFDDYPNVKIEELDDRHKIKSRWGQSFDIEQMMEHAIVHILRHRRQIERFKMKMKRLS